MKPIAWMWALAIASFSVRAATLPLVIVITNDNTQFTAAGTNVTAQTNGLVVTISADVSHAEVQSIAAGQLSAVSGTGYGTTLVNASIRSSTNVAVTLIRADGLSTNYFGTTDGDRGQALLDAFTVSGAHDVVELTAGNYALSNTLTFNEGTKLVGLGPYITSITFYGRNEPAGLPKNLLQLRDNCIVQGILLTNFWGTNWFQNILGFDYENGVGVRYTNVVIRDCQAYSHTDLLYLRDLVVDDPAPPFESSILFDNCGLHSTWDNITTSGTGVGLDWYPLMDIRFRNCLIENYGANGTNVLFLHNDGSQRLFRTTDGVLEDRVQGFPRSGTHLTFENCEIRLNATRAQSFVLFQSAPIVTNRFSHFWAGTNILRAASKFVFANQSYGLFWTNGTQFTPVKQP